MARVKETSIENYKIATIVGNRRISKWIEEVRKRRTEIALLHTRFRSNSTFDFFLFGNFILYRIPKRFNLCRTNKKEIQSFLNCAFGERIEFGMVVCELIKIFSRKRVSKWCNVQTNGVFRLVLLLPVPIVVDIFDSFFEWLFCILLKYLENPEFVFQCRWPYRHGKRKNTPKSSASDDSSCCSLIVF